jgi:hypothetical protein
MRRILVGVALAGLAACSVPAEKAAAPAPAVSTEKPAKKAGNTFSDGTWRVGADIKPGTYRANAKMGCYWERLRGFSGDTLTDVISNNVSGSDGPVTVTIKPTDKGFKSQLCGTWTKI